MLGWRQQLRGASFRGARFFVDQAGGEYGRRWADHEYPGRDTPFAEDLGRAQRVWRFTGYVLGEQYTMERDRLVKACEEPGPGPLQHPTLGSVQAVCRNCGYAEERERGRICTFTLEFAEAGELREPNQATNQNLAVEGAADGLGNVAPGSFAGIFSVAGAGPATSQTAITDVNNLADALYQVRLPAPGVSQTSLVNSLDHLKSEAPVLVTDPPQLAGAIDAAFAAFTDAGEAGPVAGAMLTMATQWQASAPPGTGGFAFLTAPPGPTLRESLPPPWPARSARARNAAAIQRFVRELSLRETGYSVTGMALDHYDQAMLALANITAVFITVEEAAADAGKDDVFAALIELRGAITRMIQARAANLNPLITYRTLASANALTLAWRLYREGDRDLEIVTRTAARNPHFLPWTGRVLAA